MKVLVACEESQRVTIEMRKLGNEAYSCDLLECSGGHPEWHIKKDVTLLLNGNCIFNTVDGLEHEISGKWDMIIAFPPCTYLTVTGNRWFNYEKYGDKAIQRMLDRNDAIKFFMTITSADCDKIAIENPVGIMSTRWRKPDQIIQPYEFGDAYEKRTCLWLKGLPKLISTKIVDIPDRIQFKSGKTMAKWYVEAGNLSKEQRALVRSKTFPGIAKAMAEQWGNCSKTCKRYEAITNPEWHHVSLATLANLDFGMLDKKRQVYLKVYRELKRTLSDLSKCKSCHAYEVRARKFIRDVLPLYHGNEISFEMRKYLDLQLSMSNVINGVWGSYVEPATGLRESRRYNRTTLRY